MGRKFQLVYEMPAVEFPQIDAFLDDYASLCKRHGLQFEKEDDYEGYASIRLVECGGEVECDFERPDADDIADIPYVKMKREELYAEREGLIAAAKAAHIAKLKKELPSDPKLALETLQKCLSRGGYSCDQDALRILIDKALVEISKQQSQPKDHQS